MFSNDPLKIEVYEKEIGIIIVHMGLSMAPVSDLTRVHHLIDDEYIPALSRRLLVPVEKTDFVWKVAERMRYPN